MVRSYYLSLFHVDYFVFERFFFFKQKTAYEMLRSLVGSEMCIRDRRSLDLVAHQSPPVWLYMVSLRTVRSSSSISLSRSRARSSSTLASWRSNACCTMCSEVSARVTVLAISGDDEPRPVITGDRQHRDPRRDLAAHRAAGVRPPARQRARRPGPRPRQRDRAARAHRAQRDHVQPDRRALMSDEIERAPVSYTHLRAHETPEHLVCRLLLEK